MNSISSRGAAPDEQFALEFACSTWDYVEEVLGNLTLLSELGFDRREGVKDMVVILCAGDRVHPSLGLDYVGEDWRKQPRARVLGLLETRNEEVERILTEALDQLRQNGLEAAKAFVNSVAANQVVYLSRSKTDTQCAMQVLLSNGLGRNELCDDRLEKHGDFLVIVHHEVLSYFEI